MAAAAMPALIKGGTALGGSLLGKLMNRPSRQQRTAMAGTETAARQVQDVSPQLMASGQRVLGGSEGLLRGARDQLGAAGGYYGKILGGDRAAAREALAPEIKTALDYYRGGAERIGRTQTGGARETALAELEREKIGNLAMMLPQARQTAAAGAERVGGAMGALRGQEGGIAANLFGQGVSSAANAGWINNYLFQQAQQQRQQEQEGGKPWGGMLYDIISSLPSGGRRASNVGFDRPQMFPVPYYGR